MVTMPGVARPIASASRPTRTVESREITSSQLRLSGGANEREGVLDDIEVSFCSANEALFDVEHYVPPLMEYVQSYGVDIGFNHELVAVDGAARKAWFDVTVPGKETRRVEKAFDMLHVTPPQAAPDFIRSSPLANSAGWVDVSPDSLRHSRYANVFSLGDVCSAPAAKTLAAARRQARNSRGDRPVQRRNARLKLLWSR